MFDPKKIRQDFPMFTNKTQMQGHDLVFLDNASTTFQPQCVIDAMNYYNEPETANSARGDYDTMYHVDQKVLKTRELVAKFINADTDEIIFTSGDTEALNLVAFGYFENHL
jgi:cysteine desulfurase/selenocysteine lyase